MRAWACVVYGANLERAFLLDVVLSKADLHGIILRSSYVMSHAFLREADLNRADLTEAWLGDADLRGADLREAQMSGAFLTNANLAGPTCEMQTLP